MERNPKKILIKLSGGALTADGNKYTESVLQNTAQKIGAIQAKGYQVALVVGGGNLFRGRDLTGKLAIRQPTADYVGMLATVQNALVVRDFFESQGLDVRVSSAISMPQVCEPYIPQRARRHLAKGRIVIFAGGLGNPYFTTDTAATQRALELNCGLLVMAKDGVDGVYSGDPDTDANAHKIDNITCAEILEQNLAVADATAISLARDNGLAIKVVSMDNLEQFEDTHVGTNVTPE